MPPPSHSTTNQRRRENHLPSLRASARQPSLRFTAVAWAKLLYLRDYGDSEVGGFAITSASDLLLVEDIRLVRQHCSPVHVGFEDDAVADYFDQQVDDGLMPEQFARIWVHTHPGACPLPSSTDEDTFQRVFGHVDWSVMFILSQEGQTYARLRFTIGPRADVEIPVQVDFGYEFSGTNWPAWQEEYLANVRQLKPNPFVEPPNWWEDELLRADSSSHEALFWRIEAPLDTWR